MYTMLLGLPIAMKCHIAIVSAIEIRNPVFFIGVSLTDTECRRVNDKSPQNTIVVLPPG